MREILFMNDFTKEELEELIWLAKNIPYTMAKHPIYEKIQYMIDNYCEHETNYDTLTLRDEKLGILGYFDRCKKCGEFLNDYQ
jgi:hypothetical protein